MKKIIYLYAFPLLYFLWLLNARLNMYVNKGIS